MRLFVSILINFCFIYSVQTSANPQGGVVVGGSSTITNPSANVMQINQGSQKAIINWQSYNISNQEKVQYVQPNSSSISLNRINPNYGASQIYGQLTANGQVWLVNPAGIYIGPSAYINVSGILATTANITDEDFMAGKYNFVQAPEWGGSITNEGNIVVNNAGLAAFIGVDVTNTGHIKADLGTVVLASGPKFTVDFTGDNLISFTVGDTPMNSNGKRNAVSNSGTISAPGGRIIMAASSAGRILDNAINMNGVAEANSVNVRNGEIIFQSGDGRVNVSGKVRANGTQNGADKGGKITIAGKETVITDSAIIEAKGTKKGGEILIGGDYQGKNKAIKNSKNTYVGKDTQINADALLEGDGGKVIVWADNSNIFQGNISARGGAIKGDGGFVEVSGKENLVFDGSVDTTAPFGKSGTLLLDPKNINIQTAGGSAYSDGVNNLFGNDPTLTTILTPASINTAAASNNIILQANTDITFTDALTINSVGSAGKSVTIQAGRSVLVNANITSNNGAISITANDSAADGTNRDAGAGGVTMAAGTSINSGTAGITMTVGSSTADNFSPGDISAQALTGTGITLTTPGSITLNGATAAGSAGTLALTAGTDISQGAIALTGLTLSAKTLNDSGAPITLASSTNNFTNVSLQARNLADTANAAGAISFRDTNAFNVTGISTTSTVDLIGRGDITQSGVMTGSALTAKTLVNAGADINFGTQNNDFSSISLQARNAADTQNRAGAISYTDLNGFDVALIGTTSTVGITGGDAITQSGAIAGTTLTAKTLNNAGAKITLNNAANALTTINLAARNAADTANAAGAIDYQDSSAIAIANVATASEFSLTSGGTVTQMGALTVGGTPTFTASDSSPATDFLLSTQANMFDTPPVFTDNGNIRDIELRNTSTTAAAISLPTSLRNLTLVFDNSAMILPAISLTGDLIATAGDGNITQTGPLSVTGTSTLNAGTNDISLTNAANNFARVVIGSADDAAITDTSALVLGANANNIDIITGGALTDIGTVVVSGLSTFTTGANNITLNNAGNNFGQVKVISANNVNFRDDAGGIDFDTSTMAGTLTLLSAGAVTQSGALSIGSTATINAGANDITLDTFANSFNTVAITSGRNVSLLDADALRLGASNISGNLDVSAGGLINQNGVLTITGLPTFTVTAANSDILLSTQANVLNTAPVFTNNGNIRDLSLRNTAAAAAVSSLPSGMRDLTLTFDNAAMVLPAVTLTGTLMATTGNTGGAITQSGALNVTGNTTLVAGTTNNILLNNINNNFSNVGITSGNNVTLADINALNLTASTVTGDFVINTGGALTDSGNIEVDGVNGLTATTVGGAVLNRAGNEIAAFNLTNTGGGAVQLTSSIPVTITGFSHSGVGTVTFIDTGTLSVADGVSLNTGNNTLALTATDLNLNTTGTLDSGTAGTTITQNTATGTIALGNGAGSMSISGGELQRIFAGTLTITAPSNGQIIVDGVSAANTANIAGNTSLVATAGTLGSISALNNSSTFTNGLSANTDNTFTIGDGVTLATTSGDLSITARNLDMNASGMLNTGANDLTITGNTSTGVGNAAGNMAISGSELQRMFANNLTLASTGNAIVVDGVALADTANIADTVTIFQNGGTQSALFENAGSFFKSLIVNATNDIDINAPITSTVGDIAFTSNTTGTAGSLNIGADVSAAGSLSFSAPNVTTDPINLTSDVTLTGNGITFNDALNGAQNLTLSAGTGDITFNSVGANTPLVLLTVNTVNNIVNNLDLNVDSFNQLSGNLTQFGFNNLHATGSVVVNASNVTGRIEVGSLALNTSAANLEGLVNGLSGREAINVITLLNTIGPGTHFFDGIDMFRAAPTPPSPGPVPPTPGPVPPTPDVVNFTIGAQLIFASYFLDSELMDTEGFDEIVKDAKTAVYKKLGDDCLQVSRLIIICDTHRNLNLPNNAFNLTASNFTTIAQ